MNLKQGNPYFLGVDGGGSKCRARLVDIHGNILGTGLSGPANPVRGLERSLNSIQDATRQAFYEAQLNDTDLSITVAGLGLAGVNLPNLYQEIIAWDHPFKALYLTSDLKAACLGAHNGQDGAVIIVGTGSCGFATVNGQEIEYGSHGFPIGDKASGAWFGLRAMEHVLLSIDSFESKSLLHELITEKLDSNDPSTIVNNMINAKPAEYAKLAPLVFTAANQNDDHAIALVKEGALYINQMAEKLLNNGSPRLSLLGGLNSRILPWLDGKIQNKIKSPINDAEDGAIFYARDQWQKNITA